MVFPSKKTSSEIRREWSRLNEAYIIPLSHFIRQLLAPKLPLRNLNREEGNVLIKELPKEDVKEAPEFDLIDSLNQLNLTFPSTFFLPHQYKGTPYFDTVLNKEGLESFMHYFTQATGIAGEIFVNADNFIAQIPNLSEKFTHSMACLVSFESTKRHMTGIYLKKENEKITAYIFDTTGLSLPGYPCGYRGYSDNRQLERALSVLSANDITPAIMPVNTVVSIQNDQFSCLMATILFFIGMQQNAYQLLKEPGITDSYGDSYFYKNSDNSIMARGIFTGNINVQMYVTTFLPLLIGTQNRLAFLFMMDPISNIDNSFSDIVSIRANWIMKQTSKYGTYFYNYFWQFTYVELLGWFNNCFHQKQAQPLPDFERIMHHRTEYFAGRSLNPFEIRVSEIERAEPALETHLNKAMEDGETAAFIAAQQGRVEIIKELAEHDDVDLNKANKNGASVDIPLKETAQSLRLFCQSDNQAIKNRRETFINKQSVSDDDTPFMRFCRN